MPSRHPLDRPVAAGPGDPPHGFEHDALVYGSDDEYVAAVVPFLEAGWAAGELVSVATTPHNAELLREALGQAAEGLQLTAASASVSTPAKKIALLNELGAEPAAASGRRSRIVGEACFGDTTREQLDWVRYEAILNEVFASTAQTFMCAYDRRELPAWVIDTAERTHAHVWTAGQRRPSPRYVDPSVLARELSDQLVPLPVPGDREPVLDRTVDRSGLGSVRTRLAELARDSTGSPDRASDVTLGLNEIVTNALEHGSERAQVRCWRDDERLVVEVTDNGPGYDDPLAGYWPPAPDQLDGRGLWLARQTLDAVELESPSDLGLRARVAVRL